jgi:hypothetical protein
MKMPTVILENTNFTFEISAEEWKMIAEKREKEAKEIAAQELFAKIQSDLETLAQLGFEIRLPEIGGRYVAYHCPRVSPDEMRLAKKMF